MSNNVMNPVVLTESDFHILKRLAGTQNNKKDHMSLAHEIHRAIIVKDSAFPQNTIRLNTTVDILNLDTNEESTLSIVLPEHADIRQKKISILTPMGAALIGFREGDIVSWQMPSGVKHFKVLKVHNMDKM